jgi:D-alanyl-D-alanine carboxypeptidase (penicillin-binding protein 5/6)
MIATARRFGIVLCLGLASAMGLAPIQVPTASAAVRSFSESKYAAIVIEANSGEVLYAHNADLPRHPASITKIMTLYMTFQALASGKLKLTDRVVLSPHAAAQAPTKLGLAAGESTSVDEAIRAMCTVSANDMAVAMAEKLGGSEANFSAMMTQKAHELGMERTHYANASGLPNDQQISTARDIAILSRTIWHDFPQFYPYFGETNWAFHGRPIHNHNHLLGRVPGVDGIKTGLTNASGFNLSASAVRDGKRLIAVVLGGPSSTARDNQVATLLNVGFEVMRRRQTGDKVAEAQQMFEQPGQALAQLPPPAEAPAQLAQNGLRPAMAPVPDPVAEPAPVRVAAAKASPNDRVEASSRKKKDRTARPAEAYVVQVGSFREKNEAKRWLTEVTDRFEKKLPDTRGAVISIDGRWRTRFEGLTRAAADSACRALHQHRLACMVMKGN